MKLFDGFKFFKREFLYDFQKWRWRNGIHIKNKNTNIKKDNRISDYQNIKDPNIDITNLKRNFSQISKIIYPQPVNPDFFS